MREEEEEKTLRGSIIPTAATEGETERRSDPAFADTLGAAAREEARQTCPLTREPLTREKTAREEERRVDNDNGGNNNEERTKFGRTGELIEGLGQEGDKKKVIWN